MVNNTLNGALMELGEAMAGNLKAMGVTDASPDNGLTTLAGRILDVEPSIKGLNLDISLVTTTTREIIGLGESIILTSTLRASYDDTTVVDVDLSGGLTGATVKFYNGTTLLGTAITDLNGIATYTYTPSQLGNFTFHTVFEGTENFTNCNSNNVNITVIDPPTSIVLQADKSILSDYDNDKCVLTATLYDNNNTPIEGLNVVFKNGDIVLATITTNSSGVAEYTYNSQGVGDVTMTVECMNLVQTFVVEDCTYYDTATYTSETTKNISVPSNFKLEFDLYPKSRSTSSGGVSHYVKLTRPSATDMWFGQGTSAGKHGIMVRPSTNYWCSSLTTLNTDNHVVVTYDGSNVLYTCNGESKSVSYSNGFGVISGISSTSNGNLKNLKIKPLQ